MPASSTAWLVLGVTESGTVLPLAGFGGPRAREEADTFVTNGNMAKADESSAAELLGLRLLAIPIVVHDTTPTAKDDQ